MLQNYKVMYAYGGMERGAYVAPEINAAFNVQRPYNKPKTAHLKLDKYAMQTALDKDSGQIPTYVASRLQDVKWIAHLIKHSGYDKVVFKLINGSGSEGLSIVDVSNELELARAFDKLIKLGKDQYDNAIKNIVMQPFIGGENSREIVINTFSYNGKIYPVAFWEYYKLDIRTSKLYLLDRLLSLNEPVWEDIKGVLENAYKRLGLDVGIGHSEFIVKFIDNKPVVFFVEAGNRVEGGGADIVELHASGVDILRLEVMRGLGYEDMLRAELKEIPQKRMNQKHGVLFSFIAQHDGIVVPGVSELINALPGVVVPASLVDGAFISKTVDLSHGPGTIGLFGDSVHDSVNTIVKHMTSGRIFAPLKFRCQNLFSNSNSSVDIKQIIKKVF